ncbi:hypothetical protein EVAR_11982_1 [Eumeta japonica]|uniref:Uncharacterized protein n=1 Tax=Eumeta variegata TaxID=151549 RepID=A0A4C1U4W1_EUMVA|nr:hypothetical protein EVAR_11982_1 [Eumeta japonica]
MARAPRARRPRRVPPPVIWTLINTETNVLGERVITAAGRCTCVNGPAFTRTDFSERGVSEIKNIRLNRTGVLRRRMNNANNGVLSGQEARARRSTDRLPPALDRRFIVPRVTMSFEHT